MSPVSPRLIEMLKAIRTRLVQIVALRLSPWFLGRGGYLTVLDGRRPYGCAASIALDEYRLDRRAGRVKVATEGDSERLCLSGISGGERTRKGAKHQSL